MMHEMSHGISLADVLLKQNKFLSEFSRKEKNEWLFTRLSGYKTSRVLETIRRLFWNK